MFPQLTGQNPTKPQLNQKGLGGDNRMVGSIATQNLGGNSLTQQMRSLQNYLSTQGESTFNFGQGITGAGMQGFGTAGNTSGTALDTTKGALDTLSPAESYWTKLLSGDRDTMNQAISPYATQSGLNWANVQTAANNNMPRGGYSATVNAQAPAGQARQVNEALFNLQPIAAQGLNQVAGTKNSIAGTQGNIASIQGQIANWLSSIGVDVSKLGAGFLDMASNSIMTGRGQDVGEHGQAMQLAGQTASTFMNGVDKALGG
jgi:hypothetical protein